MSIADDFPKLSGENNMQWFWRVIGDEKYLQSQADRAAKELWDAGIPVWRADEKGIYRLYKDGRKEYKE